MSNEISEEDKRSFSEYVKYGDFDKAEQLLRKLAESVQFEDKDRPKVINKVSLEGAQRCLISAMQYGRPYLEDAVRMVQLHRNLVNDDTREKVKHVIRADNKKRFTEYIEFGNWDGAKSVLFHSVKSGFFEEEKLPFSKGKISFEEAKEGFIFFVKHGCLPICVNLLRHRSTLVLEVKEEIENVMKEKKERISANEDTRDSKAFSKYIKCGDWEKAKIILARVAEQSSSEIERPYEQVKEDFAHGVKIRSLPVCAAIMKRYPNIAVDVEEEIKNIMQKNKENNQLNVLDGPDVTSHISGIAYFIIVRTSYMKAESTARRKDSNNGMFFLALFLIGNHWCSISLKSGEYGGR